MKIWLICRLDDVDYNQHDAMVVLAGNEKQARELAQKIGKPDKVFLDPELTSCTEINVKKMEPQVLLESFIGN